MNCASCGYQLAPDARFCTHCGTAHVFAPPSFPPPLYRDRVGRHLQALAVTTAQERVRRAAIGVAMLRRYYGDAVESRTSALLRPA